MGSAESLMETGSTSGETRPHLLVFGASGAIGGAVASAALARGWRVTGVARTRSAALAPGVEAMAFDPLDANFEVEQMRSAQPYDSVCWAQGANLNDSIYNVDMEAHLSLYKANVLYILVTLKGLLDGAMLTEKARLCVISSIWQNLARQSKLSYCVSKAALQGLILSTSADLGKQGHLINAVLPGALDTPMTRKNLSVQQIQSLSDATGFGRLPALQDVASLVCFLCSAENTGITGQFIAADLGFSHVRIL
jgi:NAD(P)-dependent dehydrogenase (short-subunit alcohol dehydrogenase family)